MPSGLLVGAVAPAAVESGAAVAEATQPFEVALPAMLPHGIGRRVAFAAVGVPDLMGRGEERGGFWGGGKLINLFKINYQLLHAY